MRTIHKILDQIKIVYLELQVDDSKDSTFIDADHKFRLNAIGIALRDLGKNYSIIRTDLSELNNLWIRFFKGNSITPIITSVDHTIKMITKAVDFLELANTR
jgi:hypothetical protein